MQLGGDESTKITKVVFGKEAREKLYCGLKIAADAVGCTMGPMGRCVIIQRDGQVPLVTKDGITVSKSINLKDPVERMGAELIREAAGRTNEVAGDGTTTATVLTEHMVASGIKLLAAGYSAQELRKGLDFGTMEVIGALRRIAKAVSSNDEVAQVGTISANGDMAIGQLIADAMEKVGRDGIITVEDAKGMTTSMEVVEGMQFERGYLSPYFVTNAEKMNVMYLDSCVLITDKKLSNLKELVPILEDVKRANRSLLIIAEDVEGEALQGLILNRVHGNFPVVAVKAPGYGAIKDAILQDIATLTGAVYMSSASGLKWDTLKASDLGHVKKIVVDAKQVTIVGDGRTAPAVNQRVHDLKAQMEDVTLSSDDLSIFKARVAKLSSGVAIIKVGGTTEMEMTEKRYRVEDALNATRAAVEEGVVPGGGVALLHAAKVLDQDFEALTAAEKMGVSIVRSACEAPIRQIVANAGHSAEVVLMKLKEMPAPQGFNAATGAYVNLIAEGIIDPCKVTRVALENAASVASTFLHLDAVILEEEVKHG